MSSGVRDAMRSRTGAFTLLEVLLATGITAMIAVSAAAWLGNQARATAAIAARLAAVEASLAVARLIDDDLRGVVSVDQAVAVSSEGTSLVLVTLASAPGDDPGQKRVHWTFDTTKRVLLRSVAGGPARVVTTRLAGVAFTMREPPRMRMIATLVEGDEPTSLPLWTP